MIFSFLIFARSVGRFGFVLQCKKVTKDFFTLSSLVSNVLCPRDSIDVFFPKKLVPSLIFLKRDFNVPS